MAPRRSFDKSGFGSTLNLLTMAAGAAKRERFRCRVEMTDNLSTSGWTLKPPLNAPLQYSRNGLTSAKVCPGAVGGKLERSAWSVAMVCLHFTRRFKSKQLRVHNLGSFRIHAEKNIDKLNTKAESILL